MTTDIAISPRVKATREIKAFIKSMGLKSKIKSKVNQKDGYTIYIDIDEMSYQQKLQFKITIADIKSKYNIFEINVSERLPF